MSAKRESKSNIEAAAAEQSRPRKRKHSGIATRGEGIRVQGDEPFDPYRFQTFEVTPEFRQRVLEAQLPLLEPRDSFLDLPPQSQRRLHAGANDVTLPEFPETGDSLTPDNGIPTESVSRNVSDNLGTLRATVPLVSSPNRYWIVAGSLVMLVLGFACTYLAMRHANSAASAPEKILLLPVQ